MEARRLPKSGHEVCKIAPGRRWQFHKTATAGVAQRAQFLLHADVVGDGDSFEEQLEDEHGKCKEDEEEEQAFKSDTKGQSATYT
eukprot:4542684-Prymnesium_polylepis.2